MIDSLKAALVTALVKQAHAALITIPGFGFVFGLPVVKQITNYILERSISWLIQETSVGLSLLWIELDMQYDVKSAEDAAVKLDNMINFPKKYTEQEQKKIMKNFDDSSIKLIQLGIKRLS